MGKKDKERKAKGISYLLHPFCLTVASVIITAARKKREEGEDGDGYDSDYSTDNRKSEKEEEAAQLSHEETEAKLLDALDQLTEKR